MSKTSPRMIIVPLIVACALFMQIFDGSVISTALPAMAQSLKTDPLHINLAMTSYLFSLAVFIPLSGWIADRYGARTAFRASILIFTLSSAACGIAQTLPQLVVARIVQGMGGAAMLPIGRLILLKTIPKARLVNAIIWLSIPVMLGPVLGPPVGGYIVTYSTWRWIFFINLPIGVLGIVLVSLFIDNIREERMDALDKRGFLLMAAALAGLVASFETVGRDLLPGPVIAEFFTGGLFCFGLYLWHARRRTAPIVDLSLFRLPSFRAAMGGGSLFRIGIGALPFLLPMMLQIGFGLSPLSSGMLTLASAVGALLVRLVAARIIRRLGFRRMMIANALISAAFIIACGPFRPDTSHGTILAVLLAGGFFQSLQFVALNTFAFADVPDALMSRATTLFCMLQQLFLSLGVATGALLLNLTLGARHETGLSAHDFWPAFLGVGIISALSVFFFLRLAPDAGAEMSGHKIDPREPLPDL